MRTVKIIVATLALAALIIAHTTAANSITYVVGNWQITLTDLGSAARRNGVARPGHQQRRQDRWIGNRQHLLAAAAFLGREQRRHYRVRGEFRFGRHFSARADQ